MLQGDLRMHPRMKQVPQDERVTVRCRRHCRRCWGHWGVFCSCSCSCSCSCLVATTARLASTITITIIAATTFIVRGCHAVSAVGHTCCLRFARNDTLDSLKRARVGAEPRHEPCDLDILLRRSLRKRSLLILALPFLQGQGKQRVNVPGYAVNRRPEVAGGAGKVVEAEPRAPVAFPPALHHPAMGRHVQQSAEHGRGLGFLAERSRGGLLLGCTTMM